jgi:hypothetical protein
MNEVATRYDIPAEFRRFFDKPPILINENRGSYEQVLKGTIETIEPQNKFEWLLVKDIVDLTWELRRLGKMKAALVNVTWKEAVRMVLESLLDGNPDERRRAAQEHAEAYFTEEGRTSVLTILGRHELTEDAIAAQAMAIRLPELDIIDRQMERARVSRMAIARDIQHHRSAGSWKRPDELLTVIDATESSIPLSSSSDRAALSS